MQGKRHSKRINKKYQVVTSVTMKIKEWCDLRGRFLKFSDWFNLLLKNCRECNPR